MLFINTAAGVLSSVYEIYAMYLDKYLFRVLMVGNLIFIKLINLFLLVSVWMLQDNHILALV